MKTILSILGVFLFVLAGVAQNSPVGVWKTIDDATGEAKSHVEIYEEDGMIYGKVVKLLDADPDVLCENCPGDKKNQPVLGMVIIEKLKPHKNYWKKGRIMDPENGNDYGCSIWIEDDKPNELKVRGKHWTGLYRTQTWFREK